MKIGIESNLLRSLLKDAYFINGTAYAGKSTMVRLLAERYQGIACGENYHAQLSWAADREHQTNLCYFDTMSGWQEFLSRSPQQYADWIDGCGREAAELEILLLVQHAASGRKIFVDTNIPLEILREIAQPGHVLIMLNPQRQSIERFFDREDEEKRFLLDQIGQSDDPARTMENFRACIAEANSPQRYRRFAGSGFAVLLRDDARTPQETLQLVSAAFGLD